MTAFFLIVAAVSFGLFLVVSFMYMIVRHRAENRPPREAAFSPLPFRAWAVNTVDRYTSGDDSNAILAAMTSELARHQDHGHATHTHETPTAHTTPSHDHGSSYGGDAYGSHHDSGSAYSGGHDSGGSFDGGGSSFDGGGSSFDGGGSSFDGGGGGGHSD